MEWKFLRRAVELMPIEFVHHTLKSLRIGGSLFKTGELRFPGLHTIRYDEPIAMPDFTPKPVRIVRFCAN